jgi:hypothetical protein
LVIQTRCRGWHGSSPKLDDEIESYRAGEDTGGIHGRK